MKFLSAIIHQHDAFSLARIKTITIDFTHSNVFLILGSNGSGKSSLLKLLVNWPDDHTRYKSGGYKIVKIQNEGSIYELTCQYNGQDKYIIKKNDEFIYKGSHGQMFATTVEQHLGFSKLYKSLLLENASVTKMNASERSEWLMKLSGIDYTWALDLYDKLKSKRNMFSGSAKVNAQRLAQMSKEHEVSVDVEQLKSRHKHLMDAVSYMHSIRVPNDTDIDEALQSLKDHQQSIKTLLNKISNVRYTSARLDSFESVQSVLERLKTIVVSVRTKINQQHEIIQECKSVIGDEVLDINALQVELSALTEKETKLYKTLDIINPQSDECPSATEALKQYNSVYTWMNQYSFELASMQGIYNPEKLQAAKQEHFKAVNRQNELNAALERISSRIEHYEEHLKSDAVECPNCKHSFITHYNKADHESSKEKLVTVKSMIEKHKAVLEQHIKILEYHEKLKEMWYTWSKFVNDYPRLSRWLNIIMSRFIEQGQAVNSQWDRLGIELNTLCDIELIRKNIAIIETKVSTAKSKNEALVNSAMAKLDIAQKLMDENSKHLQRITDVIGKYESKMGLIKSYNVLSDGLETSVNGFNQRVSIVNEVYRRHYFDEALKSIQSELATVEMQIRKNDQSSALIEGIKNNLEQDKFIAQCWGALAKAMSPKDGIIGKSLVAFLSDFFDDINNFISQVWTYELSIVPMEVDEEGKMDMDYNFKLIQDTKLLKDISHGSEAMKYIVDLAFRLTALLRTKENPIAMLDEPFTSLDQSHRSQATFAMKSLIESDLFEQLFIISHHAEFHEAFSSANVICLDPRNISVPSTANNCVKLEYI